MYNCVIFSFVTSSAMDAKTGTKVAIKKLARPFQTHIHAKRTYRELRMLKHMDHENVSTICLKLFNHTVMLCWLSKVMVTATVPMDHRPGNTESQALHFYNINDGRLVWNSQTDRQTDAGWFTEGASGSNFLSQIFVIKARQFLLAVLLWMNGQRKLFKNGVSFLVTMPALWNRRHMRICFVT